jgi:hypothetical protein
MSAAPQGRHGPRPRWPDGMLDTVMRLHSDGYSASEIGRQLGKSRDSILGQIWRAKNPVEGKPRRPYVPKAPRPQPVGGLPRREVWSAWDADPNALRRAIWKRAQEGARQALKGEFQTSGESYPRN